MTWIQKSVATVGKIFGFGVSQNFATGKAAYNLAASTGKIGDQPPMGFREAEAVRIKATNDELRYDRNHGLLELVVVDGLIKGLITGSKLDHKAKNPFFFGTNTNFGLDISYTPQGAPKSVALGLKRQEVAVVVVSPVQTTDVDVKGTAYVVPHVPSLFAGFSLDAGANGTATSMDVQEIFATGTVAEAMAMNGKTREEIMKPALLIPNDVANNLPALNRDQIDFKLWLSDLYWKSDKKRQEDIEKIATDEFNKKGEVSSIQEVFDAEPNELTEELMKAIRSKIGKLPPAPPETQAEEE
ncbi:hypothetical protein KQI84_04130 [bacterium]|nr:hypothetical protein [bacterium]